MGIWSLYVTGRRSGGVTCVSRTALQLSKVHIGDFFGDDYDAGQSFLGGKMKVYVITKQMWVLRSQVVLLLQ